jgi:hypothetical protein
MKKQLNRESSLHSDTSFGFTHSASGGTLTEENRGNLQKPGILQRMLGFFVLVFTAIGNLFTAGAHCKTVPQSAEEFLYNKSLTQLRAAAQLLVVALVLFIIFLIACYQSMEFKGTF